MSLNTEQPQGKAYKAQAGGRGAIILDESFNESFEADFSAFFFLALKFQYQVD